MAKLEFSLGDMYPDYSRVGMTDLTSLTANPDAEDQEALQENPELSEKGDAKGSRTGMIIAAIVLIVCMVVFFGAD